MHRSKSGPLMSALGPDSTTWSRRPWPLNVRCTSNTNRKFNAPLCLALCH
jgi:hypothetical protein